MRSYCPVFIKSQTDKMGNRRGLSLYFQYQWLMSRFWLKTSLNMTLMEYSSPLSVTADDKMPVIFFHLIIY